MSWTFYRFTCVTVLSELFFGKTVRTFSFHFLCRLLRTEVPLLAGQYTVYMPNLKCLVSFLYKKQNCNYLCIMGLVFDQMTTQCTCRLSDISYTYILSYAWANVLNILLLHLCYSSIGTVFRKKFKMYVIKG
jgi:hypothetical protein